MPRKSHPPAQRPSAPVESTALVPTPGPSAASAAAKAHDWQLRRLKQIQAQQQVLEDGAQAHRMARQSAYAPWQARHTQALREQVQRLDACLAGKLLSGAQREIAQARLVGMARVLVRQGQTDMIALHDRHHSTPWAQWRLAQQTQWMAQHQAAQAQAEHLAQRKAAAQARQQRRSPSATQAVDRHHAEAAQQDLRTVFRQLASALHPDREPDPQRRAEKTELMSQANAAHAKGDWLALLELRARADLTAQASAVTDAQWAQATVLLKQQVAQAERERARSADRIAAEFDLPAGLPVSAHSLGVVLAQTQAAWQVAAEQAEANALRIQDDAQLKRWLKEPYSGESG